MVRSEHVRVRGRDYANLKATYLLGIDMQRLQKVRLVNRGGRSNVVENKFPK